MSSYIRHVRRRLWLALNRLRSSYHVRTEKGRSGLVIPVRHQGKVRLIKYLLTGISLLSALYAFGSVIVAFLFGCGVYAISELLEKVFFAHPVVFIHALPDFDLDQSKWVGVGFGYAEPPSREFQVPLVSMLVTDQDYASKLENLLLQWTGGKYEDEEKNIQITVVATKPDEYIFLCHPNPKRPLAQRFFQSAKDKLRNESLKDEVAEQHISLVLGKRCKIGKSSYFPEFRKRYRAGVPVGFEFLLPPFDKPQTTKGAKTFVIFDFSIKDKGELTRKDFAYDAIWSFERGGEWQGSQFGHDLNE